jgi:outer membrane cobalamin receptor
MKTTKEDKSVQDLINKMFEIAGHEVTFDDIKGREDSWYTDWTMTEEQYKQWIEWGAEHIRKSKRLRKEKAKHAMAWFGLNYGLKLSEL